MINKFIVSKTRTRSDGRKNGPEGGGRFLASFPRGGRGAHIPSDRRTTTTSPLLPAVRALKAREAGRPVPVPRRPPVGVAQRARPEVVENERGPVGAPPFLPLVGGYQLAPGCGLGRAREAGVAGEEQARPRPLPPSLSRVLGPHPRGAVRVGPALGDPQLPCRVDDVRCIVSIMRVSS